MVTGHCSTHTTLSSSPLNGETEAWFPHDWAGNELQVSLLLKSSHVEKLPDSTSKQGKETFPVWLSDGLWKAIFLSKQARFL